VGVHACRGEGGCALGEGHTRRDQVIDQNHSIDTEPVDGSTAGGEGAGKVASSRPGVQAGGVGDRAGVTQRRHDRRRHPRPPQLAGRHACQPTYDVLSASTLCGAGRRDRHQADRAGATDRGAHRLPEGPAQRSLQRQQAVLLQAEQ
jgi:hypothetical protein